MSIHVMTSKQREQDMHEFRLDTVGPIGDCAILQVTGEVDVYTAPMLREQIRELAAKGTVHLIADLDRVDFLDSTGLGALIGGLRRLREAGGSLALVISTPRILRIFQITGLTMALAAHRSVEDAITADPHWQRTAESQAASAHEWCRQHRLS
jgi:anti-sigma B factor antagonist